MSFLGSEKQLSEARLGGGRKVRAVLATLVELRDPKRWERKGRELGELVLEVNGPSRFRTQLAETSCLKFSPLPFSVIICGSGF